MPIAGAVAMGAPMGAPMPLVMDQQDQDELRRLVATSGRWKGSAAVPGSQVVTANMDVTRINLAVDSTTSVTCCGCIPCPGNQSTGSIDPNGMTWTASANMNERITGTLASYDRAAQRVTYNMTSTGGQNPLQPGSSQTFDYRAGTLSMNLVTPQMTMNAVLHKVE